MLLRSVGNGEEVQKPCVKLLMFHRDCLALMTERTPFTVAAQ